jgi:hypothetical protein
VDPSGLDRFCIIDVSYRHFEYINKDGDQTIRIETILHQTCFDVPTAPIGGGEVDGGGGGALAPVPTQSSTPAPITSNQSQNPSDVDNKKLANVLVECVDEHYGLGGLLVRGTIAAGAIPLDKQKRGLPVLGGASRYTNPISYLGHKYFPNARLKTRILGTTRVFGILGRINLIAGVVLTAYDVISIAACVENRLGEQRREADLNGEQRR